MTQVPTRKYLSDALELTPTEMRMRDEICDWLPDEIIDCHAHANGEAAIITLSEMALKHVYSTFPDFSIEDSFNVQALFYPEKTVHTLRFANPYKGINHKVANDYLLKNSPRNDRVALCGEPDNLDYTIAEINSRKYAGLKIYSAYFEPSAKNIVDFFPYEILSAAQDAGLPIILHVPGNLAKCMSELLTIRENFPRLVIVLAHLGVHRQATAASLAAFEAVAPFENVVTDVSTIASIDVMKQVFRTLGPSRFMYGSDEPMNLLRGIDYENRMFLSAYPYHWVNKEQQQELSYIAKGAPHLHWQVLTALKKAIEDLFPSAIDTTRRMVFHDNASRVFWKK